MTVWNATSRRYLAHADLLLLTAELLGPPAAGGHPWPAAADVSALVPAEDGVGSLVADLAETLALARNADPGTWITEHARLFEAGGVCPPCETAYVRRDKGVILADLCGFYRAFGFEPAPGTGEKADHVVIELQFAALLLVLLARAVARGEAERTEVTSKALSDFVADHLGDWLPSFLARLTETASEPLLRRTAALTEAVWRLVCERHQLATAVTVPPAPPCFDPATPPETCGPCSPTG